MEDIDHEFESPVPQRMTDDDTHDMNNLIPIGFDLQEILLKADLFGELELPQIAVVGAQSTGKSTLLEALVGRSFLPKGDGIVTRRPLVLQLRYIPFDEEYGEFTDQENVGEATKYHDFSKIEKEIKRLTDAEGMGEKMIYSNPIFLTIFSPRVVDLTLVDLPGIIKVPVGDQPDDIENQVMDLIRHYVREKSTIILAVSAANVDLANSDSLKLAKEVDPEGDRTIGVITKCDMSSNPSQTVEYIKGRTFALKMGYVGTAITDGRDYFKDQRHAYRAVQKHCGNEYLAKALHKTLVSQLSKGLPLVATKIHNNLRIAEEQLEGYEAVEKDKKTFIIRMINKYSRSFTDLLEGKKICDTNSTDLQGGARLKYLFEDWFGQTLREFDPISTLEDREIRAQIRNATGTRSTLFVPEDAFQILVRAQIEKLKHPATELVDKVAKELATLAEAAEVPEMKNFRVFLTEIRNDAIPKVLNECRIPANKFIEEFIAISNAYINTAHPDFVDTLKAAQEEKEKAMEDGDENPPTGFLNNPNFLNPFFNAADRLQLPRKAQKMEPGTEQGIKLPPVPSMEPPLARTDREEFEVELIKYLLKGYFDIVRKQFEDLVRKALMHYMVDGLKVEMIEMLTKSYTQDVNVNRVLRLSADDQEKYEELKEKVEAYKEAQKVLQKIQQQ